MSGLIKAKKYDWKDSNMALFGSDTEKQVKKESAMTEPAWEGAGEEVGLRIWRIVKFEIQEWPKEDYGKFYDGDSYIVLNTYKDDDADALKYDLHFWIGEHSSQDEYGTAAYKTVELDTFLDDIPIQHRQVMGHETELFKSYFPQLTILTGGADSGFRHVEPEEYIPRLLRVQKTKSGTITATEVELCKPNLNSGDVFILDRGLALYQWNGSGCSAFEKNEAARLMDMYQSERGNATTEIVEDGDRNRAFDEALSDDGPEDNSDPQLQQGEIKLVRLSDDDGSIGMEEVKTGGVCKDDLKSEDVYLVDTGLMVFVWVGSGASSGEKNNGMSYAHSYLQKTEYPFAPVTVVSEAQTSAELESALAA